MSRFIDYVTSTAFQLSLSQAQLWQLWNLRVHGMPFQDYRLSSMRALRRKGIVDWIPMDPDDAKTNGYIQSVADGLATGERITPGRYVLSTDGQHLVEFLYKVGMFDRFREGAEYVESSTV